MPEDGVSRWNPPTAPVCDPLTHHNRQSLPALPTSAARLRPLALWSTRLQALASAGPQNRAPGTASEQGLTPPRRLHNLSTAFIYLTQSCPTLEPHGLHSPWDFPGQNAGVGSPSLLQEIFLTQGSNPGLPHCGWILYQLSHQGSPRTLE